MKDCSYSIPCQATLPSDSPFAAALICLCRYDKYCPFYKSVDMLRNMIAFYDAANEVVERTAASGAEVSASLGQQVAGRAADCSPLDR